LIVVMKKRSLALQRMGPTAMFVSLWHLIEAQVSLLWVQHLAEW